MSIPGRPRKSITFKFHVCKRLGESNRYEDGYPSVSSINHHVTWYTYTGSREARL